jgi:hypothetical protein
MATIVRYTDQEPATNRFPERIVSPPRSSPCCFTDMDEVGTSQRDGRWVFQYRRCQQCGFTVRVILREIPDAARAEQLRQILAVTFSRKAPVF